MLLAGWTSRFTIIYGFIIKVSYLDDSVIVREFENDNEVQK